MAEAQSRPGLSPGPQPQRSHPQVTVIVGFTFILEVFEEVGTARPPHLPEVIPGSSVPLPSPHWGDAGEPSPPWDVGAQAEDGGARCGFRLPGRVILTHVSSIALLTSRVGKHLDPSQMKVRLKPGWLPGEERETGLWKEPSSLWDASAEVLDLCSKRRERPVEEALPAPGWGVQRDPAPQPPHMQGPFPTGPTGPTSPTCAGTLPHSPHTGIWDKGLLGG